MGLQRKQGVPANEGEQFDIRATVEEFKNSVGMYTLWKPGMEIQVSHIRRRNIPLFVFPGGVRPSRPTKGLGVDGKSVLKPKASDSVQADKNIGVADEAGKRKLADVNGESNLTNIKRFAATGSTNGGTQETEIFDRPVRSHGSVDSSCSLDSDVARQGKHVEDNVKNNSTDGKCHTASASEGVAGEGSGTGSSLPIIASGTAMPSSREAEEMAIEKIMSAQTTNHPAFTEELDELEEYGMTDHERDVGGVTNGRSDESLTTKPAQGLSVGLRATCLQTGGSEELEVLASNLLYKNLFLA